MFHLRQMCSLLAAAAIAGSAVAIPSTDVAYAAASENLLVWRAQVRFVTGNGNLHADTDDDIQVSLNDGNHTWVDYGRNDFEVVDDFTYDLLLTNVRRLSDVQYLTVQKKGTDGWCVDNLTLLINGQAIFYRSFRTATAMCHWVDADDGHTPSFTISGSTLRSHSLWQGFQAPPRPAQLSRASIESRIEAIVGNWIEGRDDTYKWGNLSGSRYVEMTPRDWRTVHVDLDLTRIYSYRPDIAADFDFDVRFACSGGRMSASVAEVYVLVDWPILLDAPPNSVPDLREHLQAGLSAPLNALNSMIGLTQTWPCPSVLVDGGANLLLSQNPYDPTDPLPVAR
jgi:hypothetical protein